MRWRGLVATMAVLAFVTVACTSGEPAAVESVINTVVVAPTATPTIAVTPTAVPTPTPQTIPTPTVPQEVIDRSTRCSATSEPAAGRISGVNEWVNARSGPSLDAEIVGRINLDDPVSFHIEGTGGLHDNRPWAAVQQRDPERCVYVAAQFITTATGPLDRAPLGISYDLPTTGEWVLSPRTGPFGRTTWRQQGGLYIAVFIDVAEGTHIDDFISTKQREFDEQGYVPETDWTAELDVAGADRALHPLSTISESGDLFATEQRIEVGDYTITIGTGVYFEDVADAPIDEMAAFLTSVTIDRELLLETLTAAKDPVS